MRSTAASTSSVGTGRLCSARVKPLRILLVSKSARVPSVLTTCGRRNSAFSYVVKRFWQCGQRRRRRMLSPASDTRESMTCVSVLPQNGHFMRGRSSVDGKFRSQRRNTCARMLQHGFARGVVEHVGNEMRELLGLDLGEAAGRDR